MSMSTSKKLGLLGALYLSQGLPYGFFTQAMPALMRQEGISLSLIGLSSLLAMPWALKFAWAPFVDRHGSRKSWILTLQGLTILAMVGLSFFDLQRGLTLVLAGFLLANLLAATQDIATDGLAVDLLRPDERGLGNGVQVAGYRVGMIIGGGALLIAFQWLGWQLTFLIMAALLAVATIPILMHQSKPTNHNTNLAPIEAIDNAAAPVTDSAAQSSLEHMAPASQPASQPASITKASIAPESSPEAQSIVEMWRSFFRQPGAWGWVLVLLLYKAGDALATGMLQPFLVDLGLELADIGWLLGTVGFSAGLVGALVGGWWLQFLGRRRALLGFGVLQAVAVAAYAILAMGASQLWVLYLLCGLEHFAGGMATAALFTIMMDRCRPHQAATDYTLQASLAVLSKGTTVALSGLSASALGFGAHFGLAGLVSLLGVLAAYLWFPHSTDANPKEATAPTVPPKAIESTNHL